MSPHTGPHGLDQSRRCSLSRGLPFPRDRVNGSPGDRHAARGGRGPRQTYPQLRNRSSISGVSGVGAELVIRFPISAACLAMGVLES
jgi:hypothetical protein